VIRIEERDLPDWVTVRQHCDSELLVADTGVGIHASEATRVLLANFCVLSEFHFCVFLS
jgi:hypothetical protein